MPRRLPLTKRSKSGGLLYRSNWPQASAHLIRARDRPQSYRSHSREPHSLVECDGAGVKHVDVQEGLDAGAGVLAHEASHQPVRVSLPGVSRPGNNRANFAKARKAQPLAAHRHQFSVDANTVIVPHFIRARTEETWKRERRERHHRAGIFRTHRCNLYFVGDRLDRQTRGPKHLIAVQWWPYFDSARAHGLRAEQVDMLASGQQFAELRQIICAVIRESSERHYFHGIASHPRIAHCKVRMLRLKCVPSWIEKWIIVRNFPHARYYARPCLIFPATASFRVPSSAGCLC